MLVSNDDIEVFSHYTDPLRLLCDVYDSQFNTIGSSISYLRSPLWVRKLTYLLTLASIACTAATWIPGGLVVTDRVHVFVCLLLAALYSFLEDKYLWRDVQTLAEARVWAWCKSVQERSMKPVDRFLAGCGRFVTRVANLAKPVGIILTTVLVAATVSILLWDRWAVFRAAAETAQEQAKMAKEEAEKAARAAADAAAQAASSVVAKAVKKVTDMVENVGEPVPYDVMFAKMGATIAANTNWMLGWSNSASASLPSTDLPPEGQPGETSAEPREEEGTCMPEDEPGFSPAEPEASPPPPQRAMTRSGIQLYFLLAWSFALLLVARFVAGECSYLTALGWLRVWAYVVCFLGRSYGHPVCIFFVPVAVVSAFLSFHLCARQTQWFQKQFLAVYYVGWLVPLFAYSVAVTAEV